MGKHKKKRKREEEISKKKHFDSFYASAPPGMIKEELERPEDSIPDLPENKQARDFLAQAPSKGLWMPLGKEVKVMQCWRCKGFGHRTGDRECPMFVSGSMQTERFRWSQEDPMHCYLKDQERKDKEMRVQELQALLDSSSSSSSDSDSSDSSSDTQHRKKRRRKKHSKEHSKGDNHKHSEGTHETDSSSDSEHRKRKQRKTTHSKESKKGDKDSEKSDKHSGKSDKNTKHSKKSKRKHDKHKKKHHRKDNKKHKNHSSSRWH